MADMIYMDLADAIQIDGIDMHGYGTIPKLVMTDPDLTLKAKAIYAYLRSFTGNGTTTFPGRDRMLHELGINKETYYTHRDKLIEAGYVAIDSQRSSTGSFSHNIYHILSTSPRIEQRVKEYRERAMKNDPSLKGKDLLRSNGTNAAGYGMLARAVMMDTRLSINAKSLYAYLCSFAGAGDTVYPAQETLLYHLSTSPGTYRKALKELLALNYVECCRARKNDKYGSTIYSIIDYPDIARGQVGLSIYSQRKSSLDTDFSAEMVPAEQSDNFPDTDEPVVAEAIEQSDKIPDTGEAVEMEAVEQSVNFPDTGFPDMVFPDTVNPDTIINSNTINSISINSSSIISLSIQAVLADFDGLMDDEEKRDFIIDEYFGFTDQGLPACSADILYLVTLIVRASHRQFIKVHGKSVPRNLYMARIFELNREDYEYVLDNVAKRKDKVKHLAPYYLSCLYTAHEDNMAEILSEIRANGIG